MKKLEKIMRIARTHTEADSGSHGWDHAERVWKLCEHIGTAEGADLEILALAAFLHDICRAEEKAAGGKVCHAQRGAEQAGEILTGQGYRQETVEKVVHCIAAHRFRRNRVKPKSLEAKILFDADKLDALGAVGVGRAFLFAGEVGARLHNPEADIQNTRAYSTEDTAFREFSVKLSRIKDRMLTPTGKRMAEERHHFMSDFFERLTREAQGKA